MGTGGIGAMTMSETKRIRATVVDLDRTLLRTDKTLSSYTLEVLKSCQEKGLQIMVATARPWRTAQAYCRAIGAKGIVVSNGARVIYGDRQTEHRISRQSAVRLLKALIRDPSLVVTLETGEVAYSNKPVAEYETVIADDLPGKAEAEGALKILVTLNSEETLDTIKAKITDDLYYTVANGHLIQIMDNKATKWNGIKTMLDFCNCPSTETAYFGDDNDDIEPIKRCGLGVAVANAIDKVKAVADCVTESNDADGVAQFIEQSILKCVQQNSLR